MSAPKRDAFAFGLAFGAIVISSMVLGSIFATIWWNPCDIPHVSEAHSCRLLTQIPAAPHQEPR